MIETLEPSQQIGDSESEVHILHLFYDGRNSPILSYTQFVNHVLDRLNGKLIDVNS